MHDEARRQIEGGVWFWLGQPAHHNLARGMRSSQARRSWMPANEWDGVVDAMMPGNETAKQLRVGRVHDGIRLERGDVAAPQRDAAIVEDGRQIAARPSLPPARRGRAARHPGQPVPRRARAAGGRMFMRARANVQRSSGSSGTASPAKFGTFRSQIGHESPERRPASSSCVGISPVSLARFRSILRSLRRSSSASYAIR